MDINASFSQFQSTVQNFVRDNPNALNIGRPDPYQLHNKGYRDLLVSSNIFRKSLQLYNDITTSQSAINAKLSAAQDYLAQIEEKGLNEVLQSYIDSSAAKTLRGTSVDVTN